MIPDFVRELREMVGGSHLLWFPGVNMVVHDPARGVLLHRRSDTDEWSLLSGILNPGEQPAHGAVREVLEETGVRVVPERLVGVTVSPEITHPNGDRAQYLELLFLCRPADDAAAARVNDDESVEVGWFPHDALPVMRPYVSERIALALRSDGQPAWFTPVGL
ncbi:NUDIX domain-containing protein [Streptomyces sp. NPDC001795]|uniref:NUDIX hydrolase n=1 Tax=Streptomyces sp. NPDC001795 TaxID=3154525 RepID=UPI00332137C6